MTYSLDNLGKEYLERSKGSFWIFTREQIVFAFLSRVTECHTGGPQISIGKVAENKVGSLSTDIADIE
jgi:hypothetical protein